MGQKKFAGAIAGIGISLVLSVGLAPWQITQAQSVSPVETQVPAVPIGTPGDPAAAIAAEMLKLAGATSNDVVYDLSSSDGQTLITAVEKFGVRRGVGVGIDPDRLQKNKEIAQKAGVGDRISFVQQDWLKAELGDATVVLLDLPADTQLRLRPRLLSTLKPGTRIVAHQADLADWKPDRTATVTVNGESQKLYYWVVPAAVGGLWQGNMEYAPGRSYPYQLEFTQQYQQVKGNVIVDGKRYAISQIELVGDRLSFSRSDTVNGLKLSAQIKGRIAADTFTGTADLLGWITPRRFSVLAKKTR